MSKQRRRDTLPEILLRKELHRRGLRFRLSRKVLATLNSAPDILFGPARVAVYVNGCFWHGCPEHATWPASNADWWRAKIERNRERDAATDEALAVAGWHVIRVWEHEDPVVAADLIERCVKHRLLRSAGEADAAPNVG